LEIGGFMAAPFGTMQLADLGADVIKVENPEGGDPVRETGPFMGGHSAPFLLLNRNKRSLALDLKSEDGRAVLRQLIETADVLVENLRPGSLARLGFSYPEVDAINPRLVYVSASGWGQDGPLASLPGLDIMAQARSGLMSVTGMPEDGPVKVGVPICDLVCGLYVALGVMAGLRSRETTGVGQHIDVSLFEAGTSFMIWEAGRFFATGESGQRLGSAHQATAPYQAVRSADGSVTVGAVTPKTWSGLCRALALEDLLDDPRYSDGFSRHAHRDVLIPVIEEVTAKRTTAELVTALNAHGVPCAPINTTAQVFQDEHLAARNFFWEAPHPDLGPTRQIGSPVRMSATPVVRRSAGPLLGGDTADVLADIGLDAAAVQDLLARGVAATPEPRGGRGSTVAGAAGSPIDRGLP
jgi:formyl-CoA transferase